MLDANNTNLKGTFDIKIPDKENTVNIWKFAKYSDIFFDSLDSNNVNEILQNLSKLQNVPNLQIFGENISVDTIKSLDEEFLSKITVLKLNMTNTTLDNLQLLEEKMKNIECIDIENIPINYIKYLSDEVLSKIIGLEINIDNINPNENFEFLEKCANLDYLNMSYVDENGKERLRRLYSTNNKEYSVENIGKVSTDTILEALKDKDIETVLITRGNSISVESLKKLKQLKHLNIDWFDDYSITGDITELGFLQDITISDYYFEKQTPYNLALAITGSELESLRKQGVTINIPEGQEEKFFEIDARLEKMVQELHLPHDASDEEKILAITKYVVNHCEYDSEYEGATQEKKDELRETKGYYKGGFLYGALENTEHICGNFAALAQALAKRVGLECYVASSKTHAFNLINLDGVYFYLDTTNLDFMEERYILETGEQELIDKLSMYKMNPLDYESMGEEDDSHLTVNFPNSIILDENNTVSLDKEDACNMFLKMLSKEVIAALVGIGCTVGTAFYMNKLRKEIKDLENRPITQNSTIENDWRITNTLLRAYAGSGITQQLLLESLKRIEQSQEQENINDEKEEGISIDGN